MALGIQSKNWCDKHRLNFKCLVFAIKASRTALDMAISQPKEKCVRCARPTSSDIALKDNIALLTIAGMYHEMASYHREN